MYYVEVYRHVLGEKHAIAKLYFYSIPGTMFGLIEQTDKKAEQYLGDSFCIDQYEPDIGDIVEYCYQGMLDFNDIKPRVIEIVRLDYGLNTVYDDDGYVEQETEIVIYNGLNHEYPYTIYSSTLEE